MRTNSLIHAKISPQWLSELRRLVICSVTLLLVSACDEHGYIGVGFI